MKNTVANKHEAISPTAEIFTNSKGGYDIRLIHDNGETHFGFDFALETDAKYIADRINSGTKQLRAELERMTFEKEQLEKMYIQACEAAGELEKRASDAESEIRNIWNDIER